MTWIHQPSFESHDRLAIFGLAGIIKDSDMGTGVSWTLLLFIGACSVLQTSFKR